MDETYTEYHKKLCRTGLDITDESSYPDTKQKFIDGLYKLARKADEDIDKENIQNKTEELCTLFFDYCVAWHEFLVKAGGDKVKTDGDHPDAGRLKTEAGAITRGLQKVIVQFAVCEGLLKAVMKALEEDIARAATEANKENKDINWTYDLPKQVALMTKKRNVLSDYMVKVRSAKPIVEKLEFAFGALEKGLDFLLGPEKRKKAMDEYIGLLRKHCHQEAEDFLKKQGTQDLKRLLCLNRKERRKKWDMIYEITDIISLCVKKRANHLMGRGGRLFLRQWEINLAYNSMSDELENARSFLDKYEIPEIRYRRDALDRQEESLQRIANLEDMITLYEELLKARFFPMKTLKAVRAFEEGTLKKVNFTNQTVSKDLENIEEAVMNLAQGPDPESVPDDKLFEGIKGLDENLEPAAMAAA